MADADDRPHLSPLARRLIDRWQRDFPLAAEPFGALATELGASEDEVLRTCAGLLESGVIARIGPVIAPNRLGASTLAALAVPAARLDEVAAVVSALPEVNHNYEREHAYNLWFVITAASRARVDAVLAEIEAATGLVPLDLPLEHAYHIDLGFPVSWR